MKKWEALHSFYSSFGIDAYEQNLVPTGDNKPNYPYIVYEVQQGGFHQDDVFLSFSIIDRGDSFVPAYTIMDDIAATIGDGKIYELDDGYLKISIGSPWAQNQRDANDDTIRRLYSIIVVTYYTSH